MNQPENMLRNRSKENIDAIEESFKQGTLFVAMKGATQIERHRGLSEESFVREFRKKLKPVILEGLAKDWPAVKKWSFDSLAKVCGDARVVVDSYNSARARDVTFGQFVEMLREQNAGKAQPLYLQEWLYMASCPQLAQDIPELTVAQYDFRRELFGDKISTNHQLWIGQKGATTRLHQDSYVIDVMHVQIVGEKHWCVMPPDAFLGINDVGHLDFSTLVQQVSARFMQCVLKPGDVLYLPAEWYHRIELLSDSIGQGRKCLDQVNLQQYMRLRLAELLALALNHDHVKAAYPELYGVVMLRNQAWARLMGIDLNKLRP
jgi:hypothetical protein